MKSIACWADLRPYGLDVLTGEACGLSYRLLCDVTAAGKKTLEKLFSVPELKLPDKWNRGSPEDPHVGSILLVPELLVAVGIFALLEAGCREVWRLPDGRLLGLEPGDPADQIEQLKAEYGPVRRFAYHGTAGDRNQHVMSGRVQ